MHHKGKIHLLISVVSFICFLPFPSPTGREGRAVLSILDREAVVWSEGERQEFAKHLEEVSVAHALDPLLLLALIKVESSFDPSARSSKGAQGLLQLRPIALKEVEKLSGGRLGNRSLNDPDFNLRIGVLYLVHLLEKFDGELWKSLTAYNLGPTAVARLYGKRAVPATGYPARVFRHYQRFRNIFPDYLIDSQNIIL